MHASPDLHMKESKMITAITTDWNSWCTKALISTLIIQQFQYKSNLIAKFALFYSILRQLKNMIWNFLQPHTTNHMKYGESYVALLVRCILAQTNCEAQY